MRNVRFERYERPSIVRRDRIEALLIDTAKSDTKQPSDVNEKANIQPVVWAGETVAYDQPAITDRTAIAGLLDTVKSDVKQDVASSDLNVKTNIRPVAWAGEAVAYTEPAITDRTAISGLLTVSKSDQNDAVGGSDVRVKDNIVPVRW